MKKSIRFILIDDDMVNNFLSGLFIEAVVGKSEIQSFDDPEKGLEYITAEYSNNKNPTLLFLDINMPILSGWDFLEEFDKFDEKIKDCFKIYMLSSSFHPDDEQRARDNKNVAGYIEKPISGKIVMSILEEFKVLA